MIGEKEQYIDVDVDVDLCYDASKEREVDNMDYSNFLNWLMTDKKLSMRSAKDVVSRLRRCFVILNNEILPKNPLETLMSKEEFEKCSMSVKSQLKRAITLYTEYKN